MRNAYNFWLIIALFWQLCKKYKSICRIKFFVKTINSPRYRTYYVNSVTVCGNLVPVYAPERTLCQKSIIPEGLVGDYTGIFSVFGNGSQIPVGAVNNGQSAFCFLLFSPHLCLVKIHKNLFFYWHSFSIMLWFICQFCIIEKGAKLC